jgi:hypothetical protein
MGVFMTATTITAEGTLQPAGVTVRMVTKLPLSPGRVTVTVQGSAAQSATAGNGESPEAMAAVLELRWSKARHRIRAAAKEYSEQTHADCRWLYADPPGG